MYHSFKTCSYKLNLNWTLVAATDAKETEVSQFCKKEKERKVFKGATMNWRVPDMISVGNLRFAAISQFFKKWKKIFKLFCKKLKEYQFMAAHNAFLRWCHMCTVFKQLYIWCSGRKGRELGTSDQPLFGWEKEKINENFLKVIHFYSVQRCDTIPWRHFSHSPILVFHPLSPFSFFFFKAFKCTCDQS